MSRNTQAARRRYFARWRRRRLRWSSHSQARRSARATASAIRCRAATRANSTRASSRSPKPSREEPSPARKPQQAAGSPPLPLKRERKFTASVPKTEDDAEDQELDDVVAGVD